MYPGEHAKMQRTLILDIHIHSPKSIREKEIIMLKKTWAVFMEYQKPVLVSSAQQA